MRARGSRQDQLVVIAVVHFLPQCVLYGIFGTAAAAVSIVALIPFMMRFVPLEPA